MQKLIKIALVFLISIGSLTSCRTAYKKPLVEMCIISESGCECLDMRLPKKQRLYHKNDCVNYLATNPVDYGRIEEWTDNLIKELEELKK